MWTVDLMNECSGHFEHFMFKKDAVKYAHDNWYHPYITLQHGNKKIRIKDNPDKKHGDDNCQHHWVGRPGGVECERCHAILNTACNHGGSFACQPCSQGYADDLNNGKCEKPTLYNKQENFCPTCGLKNNDQGGCQNEYCKSKMEKGD